MRRKQLAERIAGVVGGLPAVEHAVAYGSAVLTNASFADSSAALDVLVAVSDPVKWHEENMRVNPSHYAMQMRMFCISHNYTNTILYIHTLPINRPGNVML